VNSEGALDPMLETPESTSIDPSHHVADLVAEHPPRAAVFERLNIDYCCGGKISLTEACASRGLDLNMVVELLDATRHTPSAQQDWNDASIDELIANIVDTHHAYARAELPRIVMLAHKVARAHGEQNPALVEANVLVTRLADEMLTHLASEEEEAFDMCRAIDRGDATVIDDAPRALGDLVADHTQIGDLLAELRTLLNGYEPPMGACTSYRAYLDALQRFERDTHEHVYKENHYLFTKVMDRAYA
jgi:regulator of cell morphogenesis and NO signaling